MQQNNKIVSLGFDMSKETERKQTNEKFSCSLMSCRMIATIILTADQVYIGLEWYT